MFEREIYTISVPIEQPNTFVQEKYKLIFEPEYYYSNLEIQRIKYNRLNLKIEMRFYGTHGYDDLLP
jgi:hypothetical protein